MSNPISSRTFYNRLHRCSKYKETNNYIKYIELMFNNILSKHKTFNIINFTDIYSNYIYSGIKYINTQDKELHKKTCLLIAINLDKIFNTYNITNIKDSVTYKSKLTVYIDGEIKNKKINLYFDYKNDIGIDFYMINSYIYNITTRKTNDCLIYNTQDNTFIKVKHNNLYYSNRRGFIKAITNSRNIKPGDYCTTCINKCNYEYIKGLDRLESIL